MNRLDPRKPSEGETITQQRRITVDSYFQISTTHLICQEYSLHTQNPFPFVVLCDGCSSSPNTDVGARILAHKALKAHKLNLDVSIEAIMHTAEYTRQCLGLPQEALDCTILTCVAKDDNITVDIHGDGIIIIIYKKHSSIFKSVTKNLYFTGNAPYYPNYLLNKHRIKNFKAMQQKFIEEQIAHYKHPVEEYYTKDKITRENNHITYYFDTNVIETILIASDGLNSFYDEHNRKIPLEKIIPYFTNFKSYTGEFIKRRAKKAIQELSAVGIKNRDDISIGGIHICNIA